MGFLGFAKGVLSRLFLRKEASDVFGIETTDSVMDSLISKWYQVTSGSPYWIDPNNNDDVTSINFAQYIDEVTSGLVTLDIDVKMPDGPRGEYLQQIASYMLQKMDRNVADALGSAGIMFKPNGENIDYFHAGSFLPTDWDTNGNILGCIFVQKRFIKKTVYTKFEYHRFEIENGEKVYKISNRAFKGKSANSKGDPCSLSEVPEWENLAADVVGKNIDRPLFGYYGNPKPNFIDRESPLCLPIWANCTEELKNLDVAWSRKSQEVEDSKHMTFVPEQAIMWAKQRKITLPRFLKGLQTNAGTVGEGKVDEHVATLLTEQRISDINSILAMISTKIGFDQGFFVLNEKTGAMTATQVEADDQSTIRTIKNLRDPLRDAILQTLYGASKMADYYTDIPAEDWTSSFEKFQEALSGAFHWGDITYNYEEDKASWWRYRTQGDVPPWMYYVKFENMSEDEARDMVEEAQPKEPTLYGEEE